MVERITADQLREKAEAIMIELIERKIAEAIDRGELAMLMQFSRQQYGWYGNEADEIIAHFEEFGVHCVNADELGYQKDSQFEEAGFLVPPLNTLGSVYASQLTNLIFSWRESGCDVQDL